MRLALHIVEDVPDNLAASIVLCPVDALVGIIREPKKTAVTFVHSVLGLVALVAIVDLWHAIRNGFIRL